MLHRAFIAKTYRLQNNSFRGKQISNKTVYSCDMYSNNSVLFSVDEFLEKLEIDKLIANSTINLYKVQKSNHVVSMEHTKSMINIFFDNIKEWSYHYIDKEVIKEVAMFYPFIRISNIDNSIISTFLFYFKYFDGKETLTVFESIPEIKDMNKSASFQSDFINTFDTSVRNSRFATNEIYRYFDNPVTTNETLTKKIVINSNYTLADFIEQNFEIDIRSLSSQSIIWTEGKLKKKVNKDKNVQIAVEDNCIYVAYDFEDIEFDKHINKVMKEFFTIVHFSAIYATFKKLIKRTKLSALNVERLKNVSIILKTLIKRLKIELSKEEKTILTNNVPNLLKNPTLKLVIELINILIAIKGHLPR